VIPQQRGQGCLAGEVLLRLLEGDEYDVEEVGVAAYDQLVVGQNRLYLRGS
jgi:hypothetical protein